MSHNILVASETQQGRHMCARKEFLTEPAKALAMAALNFAIAPQIRKTPKEKGESQETHSWLVAAIQ